MTFEGKQDLASVGRKTSAIAENQFRELIRQFHDIKFFQLLPEYTASISDMATTIVSFSEDGHTKAVRDYFNAPDELTKLERQIERAVNSHQWLHDKTMRLTLSTPAAGWGKVFGRAEDLKNPGAVRRDAYTWIKPGVSALMYAASLGEVDATREALKTHPDVNAADETGWTALMVASTSGFPDSVRLLVDAGAKINQKDIHSDTALIGTAAVAYFQQSPEVLILLLTHGARVNETNDLGESALMWASWAGSADAVKVLLKHGADRKKTDQAGHDAMFYLLRSRELMGYDKTRQAGYDRAASVLDKP